LQPLIFSLQPQGKHIKHCQVGPCHEKLLVLLCVSGCRAGPGRAGPPKDAKKNNLFFYITIYTMELSEPPSVILLLLKTLEPSAASAQREGRKQGSQAFDLSNPTQGENERFVCIFLPRNSDRRASGRPSPRPPIYLSLQGSRAAALRATWI
jgi:hypothetical protein